MGTRNGPYKADFPAGTKVRVKSRDFLSDFKRSWKLHNPLADIQLTYAGRVASVAEVGYYHGGDELYVLDDVPGVWHESCLELPET